MGLHHPPLDYAGQILFGIYSDDSIGVPGGDIDCPTTLQKEIVDIVKDE